MSSTLRSWIIASVIFAAAAGLTIFCGLSVAKISADKDPSANEQQGDEPGTDDPGKDDPAPTSSAERDPADVTDPPETTPEPTKDPEESTETEDPQNGAKLSKSTIKKLAKLNGSVDYYYAGSEVDELNRPLSSLDFQNLYGSKYPGVRVFNNGGGEQKVSLTFLLTSEFDNNTNYMLDKLAEKNIKATFFITGSYASENYGVISRIKSDGHNIGMLGYSLPSEGHANMSTLTSQMNDYLKMIEYMKSTHDYDVTMVYPSMETYSERSIALVDKMGLKYCVFTATYPDDDHDTVIDSQELTDKLFGKLHPGAVYALHTVNSATLIAVPQFIDRAIEAGFEFVQLN